MMVMEVGAVVGASLLVLLASVVVLVIALVLLGQVRTMRAQMESFASQWREEMVTIVRRAGELADQTEGRVQEARELLEEQRSDIEAADLATRSVIRTVSYPFVAASRFKLGVRRAREVFQARREGEVA